MSIEQTHFNPSTLDGHEANKRVAEATVLVAEAIPPLENWGKWSIQMRSGSENGIALPVSVIVDMPSEEDLADLSKRILSMSDPASLGTQNQKYKPVPPDVEGLRRHDLLFGGERLLQSVDLLKDTGHSLLLIPVDEAVPIRQTWGSDRNSGLMLDPGEHLELVQVERKEVNKEPKCFFGNGEHEIATSGIARALAVGTRLLVQPTQFE